MKSLPWLVLFTFSAPAITAQNLFSLPESIVCVPVHHRYLLSSYQPVDPVY
jgi:hypothetical protein